MICAAAAVGLLAYHNPHYVKEILGNCDPAEETLAFSTDGRQLSAEMEPELLEIPTHERDLAVEDEQDENRDLATSTTTVGMWTSALCVD